MPEYNNFNPKSYLQIFNRRGFLSLFDEIKENLFFDLLNGTSTQIRENTTSNNYKHYSPTYTSHAVKAFSFIKINFNEYNFLDLGCGKGKVMLLASKFRFKKITGIEIDKKIIVSAKKNYKIFYSKKWNKDYKLKFEFINKDALKHNFKNEKTIYFMFDPFQPIKLEKIIEKIILKSKNINNYLIFCNAPKSVFKRKGLKLCKKIIKNTYSVSIFKIV